MTADSVIPRQVLCVLGSWASLEEVDAILASTPGFTLDRAESKLAHDASMERAFEVAADRVTPSMTDADEAAIRDHTAVAYVLSPPLEEGAARPLASAALALVTRLFEAGASAIKSESAGIAHGKERWQKLAELATSSDPVDAALALYLAFVRRPLISEDVYYSCGMHLLGEPDVEVGTREEILEALDRIDTLAIYLLAEKPPEGVQDGHTFRRTENDPRRVLRTHPCVRYEADDFFHNPYGYLRIEKPTPHGRG